MPRQAGASGRKLPRLNGRVMVRCLGPGRDHYFPSSDARKNRICHACVRKLDQIRISATYQVIR